MANGDIAVAEAGFTAVKNTDDFRVGYDRINEVADLAVRRGIRSFATVAAMNAVPGLFLGAIAMVGDVAYRWTSVANVAKWMVWDWRLIPLATYLTLPSGSQTDDGGQGITELNVISGMCILNFSLTKAAGSGLDSAFGTLAAGFRPSGTIPFGGVSYNNAGASVAASVAINAGGDIYCRGNGGQPLYGLRGAVVFRAAN